jgi:hypothetical protein
LQIFPDFVQSSPHWVQLVSVWSGVHCHLFEALSKQQP